MKRFWFSLCFFSLLAVTACHKEAPKGELPEGQIALTFDDATVDNWYQHLGLLDSLNIRATFYISSYHTLTPAQKTRLKEFVRRGHEIAYHTASHPDLVKEVNKVGLAQTEAKEITSDLDRMKADGFTVTNFAYPFGSHTAQLNTCLLRSFKSVRALSNQQNYYKSLIRESGEGKVLYGANVDNNSRLKEEGIFALIDKARENKDCLVLVAHQIENPSIKLQISRERLRLISQAAFNNNVSFVTVNNIAK